LPCLNSRDARNGLHVQGHATQLWNRHWLLNIPLRQIGEIDEVRWACRPGNGRSFISAAREVLAQAATHFTIARSSEVTVGGGAPADIQRAPALVGQVAKTWRPETAGTENEPLSFFRKAVYDSLSGIVVRVSGYRSRGPEFHSQPYHIFWELGGLERCPLSLVRTIEELLEWKSSGFGLEKQRLTALGILCADRAITRGWHNRRNSGRSAEWTKFDSIPPLY
jgi:hypothetical protein